MKRIIKYIKNKILQLDNAIDLYLYKIDDER